MPWSLVIRALIRLLAGMFLWRTATARRGVRRPAGPATQSSRQPAAALESLREHARLGWRVVSLVVFVAAAAVLLSAGTTLTALSPRWLGITLLALAAATAVAAVADLRGVLRILRARRRRNQERQLRAQIN